MHGPLTLTGPKFPVFLFSQQDAALDTLSTAVRALTAKGVPVIATGPAAKEATTMLSAQEGLHPFIQPIAAIQSFYRLAETLARARGRNPDQPPLLNKVTLTS